MKIVYVMLWVPLSGLFGPEPLTVIAMLFVTAVFMTLYEYQVEAAEVASETNILNMYLEDVRDGSVDQAVLSFRYYNRQKV